MTLNKTKNFAGIIKFLVLRFDLEITLGLYKPVHETPAVVK